MPAEMARLLTADQLAAEVGRLVYAWARSEGEAYWAAHNDPPDGGGLAGRVVRARYGQLQAAAKAEETRRLRELMLAQQAAQLPPSS
jgi:hypothetical protein